MYPGVPFRFTFTWLSTAGGRQVDGFTSGRSFEFPGSQQRSSMSYPGGSLPLERSVSAVDIFIIGTARTGRTKQDKPRTTLQFEGKSTADFAGRAVTSFILNQYVAFISLDAGNHQLTVINTSFPLLSWPYRKSTTDMLIQ